jgi:hypothetical protein
MAGSLFSEMLWVFNWIEILLNVRFGETSLEGELYEGNSISKLQFQVATYFFELSAGNCHR